MPGEHAPDDLVFLQEDGDGFLFINPCLVSIGLGILRERLLQVGGDADVIDHEAVWLLLEDTVDAGDRLDQPMTAHRLVDIHRVHAGRIEARQPHVAHDDQFQRIIDLSRPLGEIVAAGHCLGDPRRPDANRLSCLLTG
nr:hypothetical protein [Agrobacterium pusense]